MIRQYRTPLLAGGVLSLTALPSFAQAPVAPAPAPPAEAPRAPAAAAAPAAPTTTTPPRVGETIVVTAPPPAPRPPPAAAKVEDTATKLRSLRKEVEAWYAALQRAPSASTDAAPDKTDETLLAALKAIAAVQDELPKARAQRSPRAFKRLSIALKDLEAAAEARDKAARAGGEEAAPGVPTVEAINDTDTAVARDAPEQPGTAGRKVTLPDGSDFNYGLTVSLFRLSVARLDDEPARIRNYSPKFEALPAEFGFQFTYRPNGSPWRLRTASKSDFQLMSVGGILLARVNNDNFSQGEVGVAATWQFLEDSIGLGLGFDLYRGVPVQGPDGQRGEGTAYTGLFSWAFARDGEVTPENVFVLLTVNVAGLAGKISSKGSE
jgi:hypothetical protein